MDVKNTVLGYIENNKDNRSNTFLQFIIKAFREGNLDHNQIRRAVLQQFKAQDKNAVMVGSLLLQLDNHEINEIFNETL